MHNEDVSNTARHLDRKSSDAPSTGVGEPLEERRVFVADSEKEKIEVLICRWVTVTTVPKVGPKESDTAESASLILSESSGKNGREIFRSRCDREFFSTADSMAPWMLCFSKVAR